MPPNKPGHSATVLVALATFGSSPNQIKTGKVSSVPPPAIELTTPAKNAARIIAAAWMNGMRARIKGKEQSAKGRHRSAYSRDDNALPYGWATAALLFAPCSLIIALTLSLHFFQGELTWQTFQFVRNQMVRT